MAARCFDILDLDQKDIPTLYTQEQLRKHFMKYDSNHDNLLSKEELKKAFNQLGALIPGYRAYNALKHADANGHGVVDLKELDDLVNFAYKLGYNVN